MEMQISSPNVNRIVTGPTQTVRAVRDKDYGT
jgi:hypothetical protein